MSLKIPLAERMRPDNITNYVGQKHLLDVGKPLWQMLQSKQGHSIIFWGPPGVGKTTLAQIIAHTLELPFFTISAIDSGVKDIRLVIEKAQHSGRAILFIDEIHRFNKAQQDSLLKAVEKGTIILIGATTQNPSFEVIGALLSRCQVYTLLPLDVDELKKIVQNAIENDKILNQYNIQIAEWELLLRFSSGDARKLLNILELVTTLSNTETVIIDNTIINNLLQQNIAHYDKDGEQRYDIISAFIKSIRGSDPNAALYWLARMISGGEDPKFIARRLIVLASEDIGNANPNALLLANAAFTSVEILGYPECRIPLSQVVIYLACSAKSNSAYTAIAQASQLVTKFGNLPVPLHLRNAPTKLMSQLGYGKEYKYAHEYKGNFIDLEFFPSELKNSKIYEPGTNATEDKMKIHLRACWKEKYGY